MTEILEYFGNADKLTWKRVWQEGEAKVGVFAYENTWSVHSEAYSSLAITLSNTPGEELCVISIVLVGYWAPIWRELSEGLFEIFAKNKWKWEKIATRYRGIECPFCGAVYTYKSDQGQEPSQFNCQNCGKMFNQDYRRDSTQREQDSGTKCPNCAATYVYKERHILEDGTAICHNCGIPISVEIDSYSYRSYSDDPYDRHSF
jgi:DNA-directed RNA polymerase subunit RPC12/RpoP